MGDTFQNHKNDSENKIRASEWGILFRKDPRYQEAPDVHEKSPYGI